MVVLVVRPAEADRTPQMVTDASPSERASASDVKPTSAELIEPANLARLLSDTNSRRPVILHVGFPILFRSAHITGSRHVGPASTPEGLQALKQALSEIPRGDLVVLYCGCCPWSDCPNVRPALQLARELGRKDVKLLHLPNNFQHDWIDRGLPTRKG